MKDQETASESGIMRAAASAATKVSTWSASKQEFASRVTNSGSFSAPISPHSGADTDAVKPE